MAQRRYWNWRDDDSTFDMNVRDMMLSQAGLYRGFGLASTSALNLTISHTDGVVYTKQDSTPSVPIGVWKTKQGVLVTEDANIVIPIAANPDVDDRIDLFVGEHTYTEVVGGTAAIYKIIQGVAGAGEPALTLPNNQVILARITVPAGAVDASGIVYVPSPSPSFNGDDVLYSKRVQDVEEFKKFFKIGLERVAGATLDHTSDALILSAPESYIEVTPNPLWEAANAITNMQPHIDMYEGQVVYIKFPQQVQLDLSTETGKHLIQPDEVVAFSLESFDKVAGTYSWYVLSRGTDVPNNENLFTLNQRYDLKEYNSYDDGTFTLYLRNSSNHHINYSTLAGTPSIRRIRMMDDNDGDTVKDFPVGSIIKLTFDYPLPVVAKTFYVEFGDAGTGGINNPINTLIISATGVNPPYAPTSSFIVTNDQSAIDLIIATSSYTYGGSMPVDRLSLVLQMGTNGLWNVLASNVSNSDSWAAKFAAKRYNDVLTSLKANKAVEAWKEVGDVGNPAYTNGWATNGADIFVAKFRKNDMGLVSLMGNVLNASLDAGKLAIFTLPSGYRPTRNMFFTVAKGNSSTEQRNIRISSGGVVSLENLSPPASDSLSLDGIHFYI